MVLALLNDEEQMLREMATSLAAGIGVTNPRDLEDADPAKGWTALGDAGLLGLRVRDDGIPAGSGVAVMVVAEAIGAALAPVPYLGSAVLATELLALAGAAPELTGAGADGTDRYAVLLTADLSRIAEIGDLTGAIAFDAAGATYGLALADDHVVRVPLADTARRQAADPTRQVATLGSAAAEQVTNVGVLSGDGLDRWRALALTAIAADAVGVMRAALNGVVGYARDRIAYDVPIGSFQAIQHLCAEALVRCEASASCVNYAAWAVDELDPAEALLAAHTAKAYVSPAALEVTETVMQVYGGIGQTWEHVAHLYTRRALLDGQLLGGADDHLLRVADLRLGHAERD